MKHNPNSPKLKTIFVGPPSEEQKPTLCSRCGRPVGYAYRVYEEKTDWRTGKREIIRGQYEAAHIGIEGRYIFGCEKPGLLDEIRERIQEKIDRGELAAQEYGATSKSKNESIHRQRDEVEGGGKQVIKVVCGAKGNIWTTLDNEMTTCLNCLVRIKSRKQYAAVNTQPAITPNQPSVQLDPSDTSWLEYEVEIEDNMSKQPMTADQIKKKIAASKAAKEAAGSPTNGQAASLNGGDEGAPLPKATNTKGAVKKQQVQSAKAPKTPKALNLCGCGCASPCRSRFLPGHDAKLHGWIKKLAAGNMALTDLPAMVKDGMFPKVKQGTVKQGEDIVLQGVMPTVTEENYLKMLEGKGGMAE